VKFKKKLFLVLEIIRKKCIIAILLLLLLFCSTIMATFQERLNQAIVEYGGEYDPVMRRSFQTVIMFEANRCLKDKLPSLRPFQRKLAVFDQANYLLEEISGEASLVGLTTRANPEEIMWRTATSKEPLNPESMWSRATRLTKDVERVAEQVREYIQEQLADSDSKTITSTSPHEEIYRSFVESTYDKTHPHITSGSEAYPVQFEYTHSHLFLAYKMYYRKGELDPNFPEPCPREIEVPKDKPPGGLESYGAAAPTLIAAAAANNTNTHATASASKTSRRLSSKLTRASAGIVTLTESPLIVAAGQKASAAAAHRVRPNLPLENGVCDRRPSSNHQQLSVFLQQEQQQNHRTQDVVALQHQNGKRRRELLREVKDHMDLLSQFEGLVDSETIKKRKRALFLSLPPPPPPNEERNGVKNKTTTLSYKQGSSSETESDDGKNSD
jgi:hypothetical protein